MKTITDEFMMQMIGSTKNYTTVILKAAPDCDAAADNQKIVWEHARRNFALREEGFLSIVCPISDASDVKGIGIFNADAEKTKEIMDEDPGVKAGIFIYEIHPTRSFAGDGLPA